MNPNTIIEYPKNQYKKFIKDVVVGTLERSDLIEETINTHLINDIDLNNIKNIKVLASSTEINAKFIEKLGNF